MFISVQMQRLEHNSFYSWILTYGGVHEGLYAQKHHRNQSAVFADSKRQDRKDKIITKN